MLLLLLITSTSAEATLAIAEVIEAEAGLTQKVHFQVAKLGQT